MRGVLVIGIYRDDGPSRTSMPCPEESHWHTARAPIVTTRSAAAIAALPDMDPFEPPTVMFRWCAPGSIPTAEGPCTYAAPVRRKELVEKGRIEAPGAVARLHDDARGRLTMRRAASR